MNVLKFIKYNERVGYAVFRGPAYLWQAAHSNMSLPSYKA